MAKQSYEVKMISAKKICYQKDKDYSRFQQLGTAEYISSVEELAANIKSIGLLHPCTVIKINGEYMCCAGNRRLAALKEILNWPEIPCVVKNESNFLLSFSEQVQRSDLTEIERGVWIDKAIEHLMETDEFKVKKIDNIMVYLSKLLGKSPRTLQLWRSMAKKFTPEEKARVAAGESAYGVQKEKEATSEDKGGKPPKKGSPSKEPKVLTAEEKAVKERGKFIKHEGTAFIRLSEKVRKSLAVIGSNDLEYRQNKQVLAAFLQLQKAMATTAKLLDKQDSVSKIDKY